MDKKRTRSSLFGRRSLLMVVEFDLIFPAAQQWGHYSRRCKHNKSRRPNLRPHRLTKELIDKLNKKELQKFREIRNLASKRLGRPRALEFNGRRPASTEVALNILHKCYRKVAGSMIKFWFLLLDVCETCLDIEVFWPKRDSVFCVCLFRLNILTFLWRGFFSLIRSTCSMSFIFE